MKRCYRCRVEKPKSEFDPDPRRKDSLRGACRECGRAMARDWYARHKERSAKNNREWRQRNREWHNERSRRWYHENKGREDVKAKRKASMFRYKYGIENHGEMVEASGGKCAICGAMPDRLVVDHCHETGAARELLCQRCNLGLGFYDDDPEALLRAFRYLVKHRRMHLIAEG